MHVLLMSFASFSHVGQAGILIKTGSLPFQLDCWRAWQNCRYCECTRRGSSQVGFSGRAQREMCRRKQYRRRCFQLRVPPLPPPHFHGRNSFLQNGYVISRDMCTVTTPRRFVPMVTSAVHGPDIEGKQTSSQYSAHT